ncbi:MAG: PD40 domain-containing protein, partial [Thaumarchaeota archaeon]|nr:PD40 domain-containing protein [Nitrososphaerota archaeon]
MLSEPSFSPDGKMVAFSSRRANLEEDGYESDVHIADVRRGKVRAFTTGKKDSDPKWSPDGESILFTSRRGLKKEDKGNALYVIPASGGEARLLKRSEDGIDNPQWSPDSKNIYYLSFATKKPKDDVKVINRLTFWFNGLGFTYNKRKHLYRVSLNAGKVDQLTRGAFDIADFALSRDGKRVAFLASSDDVRPYITDVFVMEIGSKRKRKLTRSRMSIDSLAWSPGDRLIALVGSELPAGFASHSRIWVLDPRSRKLQMIDKT